ncbi:MAG TPA: glycogen-binding domain-containing protein [Gemmatimonadaceae bacterium]|jgi:hypothetical protein
MIRGTILLLATGSATLSAQTSAAAALGASLQRQDGGFWQSATRLDPAVRFDNPWMQLNGDASLSTVGNRPSFSMQNANASALVATPAWRGFQISNDVSFERATAGPAISRTVRSAGSAVSYAAAKSGAWLGFGLEQVPELDSSTTTPLLRAGVWRQFRSVMVSVSVSQHAIRGGGQPATLDTVRFGSVEKDQFGRIDTVYADSIFGSPGIASRALRWSDVQARIGWSSGRVALDAQAGVTHQLDMRAPSLWGKITATTEVNPRLSIVGALGTDPTRAWMGLPPSRFAMLGLRLAPAALSRPAPPPFIRPSAASFVVRPSERGTYTVSVRVPDARTVELSGDFNAWHAVSLRQVAPDTWEATLSIVPGSYHVNMRVNGDHWTAPPGLTVTTDDFNGTVGLLVVR